MKYRKVINLLLLGPQGSGKGTQAELLEEKFGLKHLSSGDMLRQTATTNTPIGRYLRKQLAVGTLTPIPIFLKVCEQYIRQVPARIGIVFDGFGRQISEARILFPKLTKLGHPVDVVILIEISAQETIRRLSKRAACSKCKTIFILGGKIKLGDKCPSCGDGGTIIQRNDDTPAAIAKRLKLYQKRTVRVVKYYQQLGLLEKVNGEQSVTAVHQDIGKVLRKRGLFA